VCFVEHLFSRNPHTISLHRRQVTPLPVLKIKLERRFVNLQILFHLFSDFPSRIKIIHWNAETLAVVYKDDVTTRQMEIFVKYAGAFGEIISHLVPPGMGCHNVTCVLVSPNQVKYRFLVTIIIIYYPVYCRKRGCWHVHLLLNLFYCMWSVNFSKLFNDWMDPFYGKFDDHIVALLFSIEITKNNNIGQHRD